MPEEGIAETAIRVRATARRKPHSLQLRFGFVFCWFDDDYEIRGLGWFRPLLPWANVAEVNPRLTLGQGFEGPDLIATGTDEFRISDFELGVDELEQLLVGRFRKLPLITGGGVVLEGNLELFARCYGKWFWPSRKPLRETAQQDAQ